MAPNGRYQQTSVYDCNWIADDRDSRLSTPLRTFATALDIGKTADSCERDATVGLQVAADGGGENELYPFRFRDPRTGKWVRARHRATLAELASRYREWEVIGPPEIRGDAPLQMFQPSPRSEKPLELQPHLAMPPGFDVTERFLLRLFLRRYVTWCARRQKFAQMQGAARLFGEC
jgi:hypothetical protein